MVHNCNTFQQDKRMPHSTCYLCNMPINKAWHFDRGTVRGVIAMSKLTKGAIPASEQASCIWKPTKNKWKNKSKQLSTESQPQLSISEIHIEDKDANLKQSLSDSNQQRHGLWSSCPMMLQPWDTTCYWQPLRGLVDQNCPYPMTILFHLHNDQNITI